MIWCKAPAASILAFRGMLVQIVAKLLLVNQYINTRPPYPLEPFKMQLDIVSGGFAFICIQAALLKGCDLLVIDGLGIAFQNI